MTVVKPLMGNTMMSTSIAIMAHPSTRANAVDGRYAYADLND